MAKHSVPPLIGEGMAVRRVLLEAREVAFFKGVVEAMDGLAQVFAERGGDLTVAAPLDREAELDAVVRELAAELGGIVLDEGAPLRDPGA